MSVKLSVDASGYTAELTKASKSATAFAEAQDAAAKRVQVTQAAIAEAAANGSNANAKALNNFVAQLARTADAAGKTQAQMLAQRAAQLGVADSVSGYISKLEAASAETHSFSLSTSGARRELLVLAHEASQGNWTRFGGSLMVLGERMDALSLLLSPLGISLGVVGGVAYALFKTIHDGSAQFDAFNASIKSTGGFIGLNAQQMADLSTQFQTASTSLSTVREAMAQVAATGAFTADNLGLATQAALAMASDIGVGTDKAAESIQKIGDDVLKWVTDYQTAHHTFSAAQIEEIANFVKMGDTASATNAVLKDLTAAHAQAEKDGTHATSSIAQGWRDIVEVVTMYKNMIANIGAPASLTKQIGDQMAAVDAAKKDLALQQSMGAMGKTSYAQAQLDIEQKKLDVLRDQQGVMFNQQRAQEAGSKSGDNKLRLDKYLSDTSGAGPATQHSAALQKEATAFATATQGINKGSAEYQAALKLHYEKVAQIDEQYAKKTAVRSNEGAMNAMLADLQGKNKLLEAEEKRSLTTLKSQRDAGIVDQTEYLQQVHDIQAKALDGEIANSQKRADIAKGKREQTAFANANTETEKLVAQRQALDQSLTESLSVLAAQRSSDLAKFGQAEADTLRRQMEDRQQYYATLFMSPEMKVQADAAYQLMRQFQEKAAALQKQYDDPKADQAVYQAKRADLKTYYEAQLADLQQSQAMQMAVRNSYSDQIRLAMVSMAGTTKTNAELAATAFSTSFNDMQNALETFVTTGKFSFSSFASSVLSDLAKIALKAAESQIFNSILGGTSFFSAGGSVGHFATGGSISGPGTGTSDSIPAMLSNGEYVVKASAAKKYGSLLESINNGHVAHFATGGAVGSVASTSAEPASYPVSLTLQSNAGGHSITNEDLMYMAPLIQNLIDKRMAQKIRGQGGYADQIYRRAI